MKKLILLFLLIPIFTFSQKVSNITSVQNGSNIDVNYKLSELSSNQSVKVNLYYSVNGASYSGPLQKVSGDIGGLIAGNGNKKISWDVVSEIGSLEGDTKFKVEIIPTESYEEQTATENNIKATLVKASQSGSNIYIDLVFEPGMDANIGFYGKKTFFFDENGLKYFGKSVKWGNNTKDVSYVKLMKGVPFRIQYIITEVGEQTKEIKALEICYSYKHNYQGFQFRDVNLIKN